MREGGQMLATVLSLLNRRVEEGMSTKELADIAKSELQSMGAKPAFLGYQGFPDVLCISINDEVVHGIPSTSRLIKNGNVVGMDFGVLHRGLITDGAITTIVGGANDVPAPVRKLVASTKEALKAGVSVVRDGVSVGDIAAAVQVVLDQAKLGVVRDLVGHGVGHHLHEAPNIPNFGRKGTGPLLKAGMTIAIEPMATMGGYRVFIDRDGWTVKTSDRSLSAHFEHTILITEEGAEVLTEL